MNADRAEGDEEVETSSAGATGARHSGSQEAHTPIASHEEPLPPEQWIFRHRRREHGCKARLAWRTSIGAIAFALFVSLPLVRAADGDLDPAFGNGGKVTANLGSALDDAHAVAVQADGKIVVVGVAPDPDHNTAFFALARFNPDGSLDTGFGFGGKVVTDFGGPAGAFAVAIQSDGKIVAAGAGPSSQNSTVDFALVRYNPNGSLDTSFGTVGMVTTDFGGTDPSYEQVTAMAIQSDGKIVVTGSVAHGNPLVHDTGLARYNSDGSPDTSFGNAGTVLTDFSHGYSAPAAIALQSDGKIVVAGAASPNPDGGDLFDFALARYNPNGSLDFFFGNGGKILTDFGGPNDYAGAVLIQGDGKIVAAGYGSAPGTAIGFALARYNLDGAIDASFGAGGETLVATAGTFAQGYGAALQADGKIVEVGRAVQSGGDANFAVARFNSDGSSDATFGAGIVVTDFAADEDSAEAVAIQGDGKIVAAGIATNGGTGQDFAVARYLSGGGSGGANADLGITMTAQPATVAAGGTLTYLLTIANNGPSAATDVVVLDTLPSTLTFGSATTTGGGTVSASAGNITVAFASIAPAQTATITLITSVAADAPGGSTITNTADVGASTTDPDGSNNTATIATAVAGPPPPPHPLTFYLHGDDLPPTAAGFTMNQTAPASQRMSVNFSQSPSWFSNSALSGTFQAGAIFTVKITRTLGLLTPATTYRLSATNPDGSGEQLLGLVSAPATLLTQPTITLPVATPVTLTNQRLKLTVTTGVNLGSSVQLGSGTYVQVTGFAGTP